LVLFTASCGGDDSKPSTTGGGCTNFDYGKWTPNATPVSFETSVMPILNAQCSLATACHGKGAINEPILGDLPNMMTLTAADIKANIVGKSSKEVTTWQYVNAGNPQQSYLMRKIEDANPGCGLACTSTPPAGCATQMPNGANALSPSDQDLIRNWIQQGAK
jgi:hypothetical protein